MLKPVVEVNLWSGLRKLTGGADKIQVEAKNIAELLEAIVEAYPELQPVVEAGVSVAIDGKLVANDRTEAIYEDSEIFLLEQLKGG